MNTKNYIVVINEEKYTLISDEQEAHIQQAATLVDTTIASLSVHVNHLDKRKIAILAAMQLASRYLKSEELLSGLKKQEEALVTSLEQQVSSL